jgi:hypothetical protein
MLLSFRLAPCVLSLLAVVAGCAADLADPEERIDTDRAAITGPPLAAPPAGLARIHRWDTANVASGVLVDSMKFLTGTANVPANVGPAHDQVYLYLPNEGGIARDVDQRWDHPQYGVTMYRLTYAAAASNIVPVSATPPSALVGTTLSCAGYDATNTPLAVGLTVTQTALTGYRGTFSAGGTLSTSDDGVPCRTAAGSLTGLALSTSAGVHTQAAASYLAPWIADPTTKTLTFRRRRSYGGAGTVSSSPSGLASCNSVAYDTACNVSFANGSRLEITASPSPSSVVTWTGCTSASGNVCTVHVSGSTSVSARFTFCPDDCYDTCYDDCIEDFGSTPSQCASTCNGRCAVCD